MNADDSDEGLPGMVRELSRLDGAPCTLHQGNRFVVEPGPAAFNVPFLLLVVEDSEGLGGVRTVLKKAFSGAVHIDGPVQLKRRPGAG